MTLPTFDDVLVAAERIQPYVHRTPVLTSSYFDGVTQSCVFFKAENFQKVGAFKARGALNAVLSLTDDEAALGIVTHSSGNHGQAVAYAGGIRDVPVTVVMPHHASKVKVSAVEGYGATIVFCDQSAREGTLLALQERTGAAIVHPFDDAAVIAGQGTASLELVDQIQGLDLIIAPIGGGGLLSGASLVAAADGIEVLGAEPSVVDDSFRSLRDNVRYPATGNYSVGDGLLTGIGALPFAILSAASRSVLTVSEEQILTAMRQVATRMKVVIEPSAATAVSVLLEHSDVFRDKRVGIVLSGGNVDLDTLADQR